MYATLRLMNKPILKLSLGAILTSGQLERGNEPEWFDGAIQLAHSLPGSLSSALVILATHFNHESTPSTVDALKP